MIQTVLVQSLLLHLYAPMLQRLRKRLRSSEIASAELDQTVLCAFTEVLQEAPRWRRRDRLSMRLKQETKRKVFRQLQREHRRLSRLHPLEDGSSRKGEGEHTQEIGQVVEPFWDLTPAWAPLERIGQTLGWSEARLDLIRGHLDDGEPVDAYLARRGLLDEAQSSLERGRLRERVLRERSRALLALRAALKEYAA